MEKRTLGRTGLEITAVAFGAARLSEHLDAAVDTVKSALDLGINFIDTARSYGDSQEKVGHGIKGRNREDFYIATKTQPVDSDMAQKDIEASLSILGLDNVDLFYVHGCNDPERFHNTMRPGGVLEGCQKARDRGLTRYVGISFDHFQPMPLDRMRTLIETDEFDVIQVPFNLVRTERVDEEIIPLAKEKNIGVFVNYPTYNGHLTQEWGVLKEILGPYADTPGQAALLYILSHDGVSAVLSGMSTPQMAEENVAVGHIIEKLSSAERRDIVEKVEALGLGPCRSCALCHPYSNGIPVQKIMFGYDCHTRFGYEWAKEEYESYREQVESCEDLKACDEVCPYSFDVLKMLKDVYANRQ